MTRWGFYRRVSVLSASYVIPLCFLAWYLVMNWVLFGIGCEEILVLIVQIIFIASFVA